MDEDIAEALREVELEIGSRRAEHQIDPTLDRIGALVSLLGDPQRAFPVVHVTGTNGKTSTTRMIETLLRERGLRTGRFTSPHLVSMRERITIDGVPISAERFIELYEEITPYVQLVDSQQPAPLSFFEILTGMMFAAFADAPVDVAVIEVGLGGRWDATNVADGQVAVITPVALDHMQWLGDTVEAIATEKAGIIKPGATVVIAQQPYPSAAEILLERAELVGASVVREGFEFGVLTRELALGGQQLVLQGLRGIYGDVFLPLFGAHQASNAACALAAVEAFAGVAETVSVSTGSDDDGDSATATLGYGVSSEGLDPELVRAGFAAASSPGPARHPAPLPDGDRRRRAQPGRHGRHRVRAERGLRLRAGHRRRRGGRGQGRGGPARGARAGAVRDRGDDQLLAPVDAGGRAGRAGPRLLRRGPGPGRAPAGQRPRARGVAGRRGRRGLVRGRAARVDRGARHRLGRHRGGCPAAARPGQRRRPQCQLGLRANSATGPTRATGQGKGTD